MQKDGEHTADGKMGRRQELSLATSGNQFKTDLFISEVASLVPAFEIAVR